MRTIRLGAPGVHLVAENDFKQPRLGGGPILPTVKSWFRGCVKADPPLATDEELRVEGPGVAWRVCVTKMCEVAGVGTVVSLDVIEETP